MSITMDEVQSVLARPGKVYSGSHKVGAIGQVYVDDSTGQPSWVTVKTGLFGTSESFAPLAGARVDGNDIVVGVDEQAIASAPRVDPDGSLSPEEEDRLYRHYGLHGHGDAAQQPDGDRGDLRADVAGTVGHDTSGPTTDDAMTRSEEQLRVSTRTQEVGRARLRKYVVSEQVRQTVPVRREEVSIDREALTDSEAVASPPGGAFHEQEIEIVLHEEVPVVDKELVAAERIRVGKRTVTEDTTVSGEVRKERIELDDPTRPDGNQTLS
jgi:uncharacterized protein (TIGR02271 family)